MTPISKIIYHINRTEFTRYLLAGSLTFLMDLMTLVLLTEFIGLNYLWSNLVGVFVGIVVSYILCVKWVFLDRRYNRVVLEFPIFLMTCLVGVLLNELMLWGLVEFGGVYYITSKIVVTAVVFVVNFLLKKTLLFRKV
jgi:putative flippase GtrA